MAENPPAGKPKLAADPLAGSNHLSPFHARTIFNPSDPPMLFTPWQRPVAVIRSNCSFESSDRISAVLRQGTTSVVPQSSKTLLGFSPCRTQFPRRSFVSSVRIAVLSQAFESAVLRQGTTLVVPQSSKTFLGFSPCRTQFPRRIFVSSVRIAVLSQAFESARFCQGTTLVVPQSSKTFLGFSPDGRSFRVDGNPTATRKWPSFFPLKAQ
jgi:hypothetical protein